MTTKRCPSEAELLSFVDADRSPEELHRTELHLQQCSSCLATVTRLRELIADIAAPLPEPVDSAAHLAQVLARLDQPVARGGKLLVLAPLHWALLATAAAAALVLLLLWPHAHSEHESQFAARGASSATSLARDVGVQLYANRSVLAPLQDSDKIQGNTAFTAGVRNLASKNAYLLLFALDSQGELHWIAPQYTAVGSDPQAYTLLPSAKEQLLPSSVVFDGVAAGPLRLIALITPEPTRVSQIERLTPQEITSGLLARFPGADVRQLLLSVSAQP